MLKRILLSFFVAAFAVGAIAGNICGFNATQSGDTIKVVPGTYGNTYVSQPPITGRVTVINAAGSVFTGTIFMPDVFQDVVFINFTFQGVPTECVRWSPNSYTEKAGVQAKNIAWRNCKADKCYAFTLWGTYSDITLGLSLSQNIEFSNITVTNSGSDQVFFLSKCFGMVVKNNVINGTGSPAYDATVSHDAIFFLHYADGEFSGNTIRNHMGNGFRIYPSGITKGTAGNISLHDNYIEGGRKHSAFETNGNNSPAGYFANISIKNNTAGNLAAGVYHSAVLSAYPQPSGSKVYFENNIGFNTDFGDTMGANPAMHLVFTDTNTKPDSNINNWYYDSAAAAGVDLASGKLLTTAPQAGKAGAWASSIIPPGSGKTITKITLQYSDGTTETKP